MKMDRSYGAASFFLLPGAALLVSVCLSVAGPDAGGAALQAALKGTWQSVCMDLGSGIYTKTTKSYDGKGKATSEVVFYSDAACSNPTGLVNAGRATYVIGDKVKLEGGQEAYAIDVTITKFELKQGGTVIKSGGPVGTQYDVIAVEGDKLYNSGLTRANKGPILDPSQRPTTLDRGNFYTKK